jgi:hypothetical protein
MNRMTIFICFTLKLNGALIISYHMTRDNASMLIIGKISEGDSWTSIMKLLLVQIGESQSLSAIIRKVVDINLIVKNVMDGRKWNIIQESTKLNRAQMAITAKRVVIAPISTQIKIEGTKKIFFSL